MPVVAAVGLAARVAGRSKVVRDAMGRFSNTMTLEKAGLLAVEGRGAVDAVRWLKPHSSGACGKGQYKSAACKARAIAKHGGQQGALSPRQGDYLKQLNASFD